MRDIMLDVLTKNHARFRGRKLGKLATAFMESLDAPGINYDYLCQSHLRETSSLDLKALYDSEKLVAYITENC